MHTPDIQMTMALVARGTYLEE